VLWLWRKEISSESVLSSAWFLLAGEIKGKERTQFFFEKLSDIRKGLWLEQLEVESGKLILPLYADSFVTND
jgi:hypothetical protein